VRNTKKVLRFKWGNESQNSLRRAKSGELESPANQASQTPASYDQVLASVGFADRRASVVATRNKFLKRQHACRDTKVPIDSFHFVV